MAKLPVGGKTDSAASKTPAKTPAPKTGVVPNFTPSPNLPKAAAQPGSAGFVGPTATTPVGFPSSDAAASRNVAAMNAPTPIPAPSVPAGPTPVDKKIQSVTYRGTGLERIKVTTYTDATVMEEPDPVTAVPGATGGNVLNPERVLARDTFANTFALAFGADEASKDYVSKLYELTSSFYKTGSTIDESINLAVRKARVDNAIPEFTNRFKGLFALDDMLKAGKLVKVPTVAQYIASEVEIANLLDNAGMGEIATSEVIGTVLGKGKSVAEVGRILTGVFATIDNAPEPFKKVLSEKYPTVTRTGLAMALIGGTAGSAALEKEVKNLGIVAAAKQQGVALTAEQAANIATLGYEYQGSLSGLATVAQNQGTYQKLYEIEAGKAAVTATRDKAGNVITPGAAETALTGAIFGKNAEDISAIDAMTQREINRYRGSSGRLASKSRAQGLI